MTAASNHFGLFGPRVSAVVNLCAQLQDKESTYLKICKDRSLGGSIGRGTTKPVKVSMSSFEELA